MESGDDGDDGTSWPGRPIPPVLFSSFTKKKVSVNNEEMKTKHKQRERLRIQWVFFFFASTLETSAAELTGGFLTTGEVV